jgi:hypothetical protein
MPSFLEESARVLNQSKRALYTLWLLNNGLSLDTLEADLLLVSVATWVHQQVSKERQSMKKITEELKTARVFHHIAINNKYPLRIISFQEDQRAICLAMQENFLLRDTTRPAKKTKKRSLAERFKYLKSK